MTELSHEAYMEKALQEAEKAAAQGEVPVGAVIIKDGLVLARAYNMREQWRDATAHAEVIAIREACRALQNWRLTGCTLYVTVEPCPMCAGAIFNSRVDTVVFGCRDNRAGAVESLFNVPSLVEPSASGDRRHLRRSLRCGGKRVFCQTKRLSTW